MRMTIIGAIFLATSLPAGVLAQELDMAHPPRLTAPAPLKIPPVQRSALPNGFELYVIEQHEVPVVQLVLSVKGGGRADQDHPGLASFTAGMLDEGADTLDAFGIAAQAAYLGADLNTGADWDRSLVSLKVPARNLVPAVDLMATVVLDPSFRSRDVNRQRDLRLAAILQQRDRPDVVASLAFNALVFPGGHPYHQPLTGDSAATASLDSALVREFYRRSFRPDRASMILSGDITLEQARRIVTRAFGRWKTDPAVAALAQSRPRAAPPSPPTTVYLVDKPGAAQSVIAIGNPGVERLSPDYYALQVMNVLLGGSFSSRLNQNLRETKGYTYGAGSGFEYRPLPGPFVAQAAVRSDVTDSSLVEFFREFKRIRDSVVPDDELRRAKAFIALQLPGEFETAGDLAGKLSRLLVFGLPLEYYRDYIPHIMRVTAADVQRVARKYVRPNRVSVVVVGDAKKIRPGIAALGLGPLKQVDLEGRPVH
ncbi:MAG: M16 family metallopeptidase [Gemmatimonadales bacterium]